MIDPVSGMALVMTAFGVWYIAFTIRRIELLVERMFEPVIVEILNEDKENV